jgi:tetratricopeptide (TPR) repeat protein
MFKRILVFLIVFVSVVAFSYSEDLSTTEFTDLVEEFGIPTLASVDNLKTSADQAYSLSSWADAAELYENHSEMANYLANIISQGLEPYYSASYDDKKGFSYSSIRQIAPDEIKSNVLKKDRNISFLRMGICYYKLGDFDKSLPFLMKALDLIDLENIDSWNEARKYLYDMIGYTGYLNL